MESSRNEQRSCSFCGKPAVEEYTRAGRIEMVCASCGERWRLQDTYEDRLLYIVALEDSGKYDDAIACLDSFLESNRERDRDGWLARNIAAHRAMIFMETDRYAHAEEAWNAMAQAGFADVSERFEYAEGKAHVLDAQGRAAEATALLEDALGHPIPWHLLPSALWPLAGLAHTSEKLAQPLDPKWLRLAEAIAKRYGMDIPVKDSVAKAILALSETIRSTKAQPLREKDEGEQALFSFK
jgi:tetratricopeptide (TPR) repeat protein